MIKRILKAIIEPLKIIINVYINMLSIKRHRLSCCGKTNRIDKKERMIMPDDILELPTIHQNYIKQLDVYKKIFDSPGFCPNLIITPVDETIFISPDSIILDDGTILTPVDK